MEKCWLALVGAADSIAAMGKGLTVDKEIGRMAALGRYDILDTPPDGNFDAITALAARLLKVPIALTTLVDTDRIWFKSRVGVDIEQIDRARLTRARRAPALSTPNATSIQTDPRHAEELGRWR